MTDTRRHPPGLAVLFFTEMWERFSYYGMRALLVLYLVHALGYARADALAVYGTYTALVYLTPLLGGALADRYLGARAAALIGGLIMMLGHFAMAFPALLHLALGLLVVGNGFFKPNTSSLVGQLYPPDDARRDGAYTIFYMGINLGALFSPLVAGTLGERLGWHWGFASAGVGMALGVLTLLLGQRWLGTAGLQAGRERLPRRDAGLIAAYVMGSIPLVLAGLALWPVCKAVWGPLPGAAQGVAGLALLGGMVWLGRRPDAPSLQRDEWRRVLAIALIAFFVIFFWMGFEQAGGTMNLFADKQTERWIAGVEIPASWFQSINPLAIVVLAPLFSMLWNRLDRTPYALSDPAKQGLGMIVLGAGFALLAVAQQRADAVGKVGPQWLAAVYLIHTVGELMLSPIGLSLVSKVAPVRLAGVLMGVWLASTAIANYLAGHLEALLTGSGIPLYGFLVGASVGAGLVLLALTPWLNRLMRSGGAP